MCQRRRRWVISVTQDIIKKWPKKVFGSQQVIPVLVWASMDNHLSAGWCSNSRLSWCRETRWSASGPSPWWYTIGSNRLYQWTLSRSYGSQCHMDVWAPSSGVFHHLPQRHAFLELKKGHIHQASIPETLLCIRHPSITCYILSSCLVPKRRQKQFIAT